MKLLKNVSWILLAIMIVLLPQNAKVAQAAAKDITIKSIEDPAKHWDYINDDSILMDTIPGDSKATYIYKFTLEESGWVQYFVSGYGHSDVEVSKSSSFATKCDRIFCKAIDGYNSTNYGWYLDAGTYYLSTRVWPNTHKTDKLCYISFVPTSAMFTYTLQDVDCTHKTLTVESKLETVSTGLASFTVENKLINSAMSRKDLVKSAEDTYDICADGDYTIVMHSEMTAWKDFDGMYHFSVYGLGNHAETTTVITKASFEQAGSIAETCTKCGAVISTSEISALDSVSLGKSSFAYTGKVILPSVIIKDKEGTEINAIEYVVSGKSKKVGVATATVTMDSDYYEGTKTVSYIIIPKTPTVPTIKNQTGQLTVTAKKTGDDYKGYEYQVSTSKSFTKKTTTSKLGKKKTATKMVFKNLKSKKNYYVRIRTYQTVKGKTYYSEWTKTKKIKVK